VKKNKKPRIFVHGILYSPWTPSMSRVENNKRKLLLFFRSPL
jgi:hypothetical protein